MKKIMTILMVVFSPMLFAETLNISQTVAAECTFSNNSTGVLGISGTSINTTTPASIDISNNDPNVFTLSVDPVSTLSSPDSQDFTSAAIVGITNTSGVNSGQTQSGTPAGGYTFALPAVGSDSFEFTANGTLDGVATAGSYTVGLELTCAAI